MNAPVPLRQPLSRPFAAVDSVKEQSHDTVGAIAGVVLGAVVDLVVADRVSPGADCRDCDVNGTHPDRVLEIGVAIGTATGGLIGWFIAPKR